MSFLRNFALLCISYRITLRILKESYRAQNSLELKLPFKSSPSFYAKQSTLSS